MKSLYTLVLRTNLKSPTIAFPLIMPLIFILLYSVGMPSGLGLDGANAQVALYFTTILSITTMQSGLMGFGISFISLKKSVMLKRIGATELSKADVVLAILLYGLTLWLISFVWIFIMVIFFSAIGVFASAAGTVVSSDNVLSFNEAAQSTAFGWMSNINWGRLTLATLVMLFASYGLGLFFTTVAHDDQMYMGMAMLYFFFAGFIGGLMFPGDMPAWMEGLALIVPHAYVGYLYDWAAGNVIETWQMVTGLVVPLVFGVLITGAAIKLLKFD